MAKISKIKSNYGTDNAIRPVLVDFQNGVINMGQEKNLKCGLFDDKSNTICGVTNGNLTYAGTVDRDDLYTNYILQYNKKKNKIKLIQVDHCTLAPLHRKEEHLLDVSVTDNAIGDLNKTFGSKRAKRQTEQREKLQMNIESVKQELEKSVTDVKVEDDMLGNTAPGESQEGSMYPKINRQASSIDQVYKSDELVPADVLESLQGEATRVLESDLKEVEGLSNFISANISQIQSSTGSAELKIRKTCILLYVNYLMSLLIAPLKTLTRKNDICPTSKKVDEHLKNTFLVASKNVFHRPLSMKDKSLCYILVLSVLAMDYHVNIERLPGDIKVSSKKIGEVARVLALTADKVRVKLKLPLPAMVTSNAKRRKTRSI